MEKRFPKEYQISKAAYKSALRAKVLDCLRGLLPVSTLTNMGVFGNGRFFENLIKKLTSSSLTENQEIGKKAFLELSSIIPSFIKRAEGENKHFQSYFLFSQQMKKDLKFLSLSQEINNLKEQQESVSLIDFDKNSVNKVAASLLFDNSNLSLEELNEYVKNLSYEDLSRILDAASNYRENRRHKSPRALEICFFTFEIVADFGIYRDLQRHRILSQQRQLFSCDLGFFIPEEIKKTDIEMQYVEAMKKAKKTYDEIKKEFPEEAQYVIPLAYNVRFFFHINLRSLQWLAELRSSAAGHPSYRYVAQRMVKIIIEKFPQFERFFKFVDFDGYDLGRMDQENRRIEKGKNKDIYVRS
jgi:thymidylate synthase ThyX